MPLGEHADVVVEVDQQDVFAEVLERRAGVAGSQLATMSAFVFISLPKVFHMESVRGQAETDRRKPSTAPEPRLEFHRAPPKLNAWPDWGDR